MKNLEPVYEKDIDVVQSWQCLVGQFEPLLAVANALTSAGQGYMMPENEGGRFETFSMIGSSSKLFSFDLDNKRVYVATFLMASQQPELELLND